MRRVQSARAPRYTSGMQLPSLHGLDVDRVLYAARGAVLLVVTREGCGACRATKRALAEVPAPAGLEAYEVDAGSAPALVEELGIFHLPALWLFREGEPVGAIGAPPTPVALAAGLTRALLAETPADQR